ncbi:branched chain amino acid aminotransferase apoenzyme [Alteribacillus persepolensis]|uniref:Branched-chain-amino-acid aminotransferase n=1 Tax=Alteribacillus persepolensis TaxID=568899 RepID=A0A1G8AXW9_9BACI|nr:branched-chain amino acid aminotransferase [Alteribacillus persepolensis]SDH25819.1 branched chain amino acid aminotransferase apoenzyme [Alteribacillus persepolensis]
MDQQVTIYQAETRKAKPDYNELSFGKHFTDHMFVMDYSTEKGWYDPRITPYEPLLMDPSSMVFHYGQSVFEGLKAYHSGDDVLLFRPEKNFERLNKSNERMNIPAVDVDFMVDALKQLVDIDHDWIPTKDGQSLYIRPFIISTEAGLSVRPASQYKLMIIMTPVGAYYSNSDHMSPVKIYVEDEFVRSVKGGVGFTKTSGNYAASLKAQTKAAELGYDQVLWLDALEKKYVEEVGSMNIFFKIDGEIVTPALNGSILSGITRNSVIELLRYWGYTVNERRISIEEVYNAQKDGTLEEVFGTGTAAVISPVGTLKWKEEELVINNNETGDVSLDLYETISGIQTGKKDDVLGWTIPLGVKQT